MKRLAFGFLFVSLMGVLAADSAAQTPPAVPPVMEMVALPTLPGFDSCIAIAINNRGQVIGECTRMEPTPARGAFVWENGVMTGLGTLGGVASRPYAINDAGQIVGDSFTSSGDVEAFLWEEGVMTSIARGDHPSTPKIAFAKALNEGGRAVGARFTLYTDEYGDVWEDMRPFVWQKDGGMTDIGGSDLLHTQPNAINKPGQVLIGSWETSTYSNAAWLWHEGSASRLKALSGGSSDPVFGNDLNDAGQVVGSSRSGRGIRATLWTAPEGTEIPMPAVAGDVIQSWASRINEQGKVIGTWVEPGSQHGFFWDGAATRDLGFLGAGTSTTPVAVNNLGQVVGFSDVHAPEQGVLHRAFLWQEGVLTDLGTLSEGAESMVFDINDLGQAVGVSRVGGPGGHERATLWRPLLTPEQKIASLVRQIRALVSSGALAQGPGNALVVSLHAALAKLAQDNTTAACNTLHAFVNKVRSFVADGTLTTANGDGLLAAVNAIIPQVCE